jgi:hypothetical protein
MVVDRMNRVVLALIGLLLMAGGAFGLARGLGAFGQARRYQPLLDAATEGWFHDHRVQARIAGLLVAVVVAILAARWLVAQLRRWPTRSADAEIAAADPVPWEAVVAAAALQESVVRQARRREDVSDASARVDASSDEAVVALRVATIPGADLGELTGGLQREALHPLVRLLASSGCEAHITFGTGQPPPRVVV